KKKGKTGKGKKRIPLSRKISREMQMWIRRIHLYSGLFMFPWVLMYGFSGWFFNHPGYYSGDQLSKFSAASVADGKLLEIPDPQSLAPAVVEQINLESANVDGPETKLTTNVTPHFDRYLSFSVTTEGQSHRIEVHPESGNGSVRTTLIEKKEESDELEPPANPLEFVSQVELEENSQTYVEEFVPGILEELELESGEVKPSRFSPSLIFSAEVDGEPTEIAYNLGSGSVRPFRQNSDGMTAKRFLQRLHLSRGYSPNMDTKTFWAISVDAMFLSMVFWGTSGIIMWWQIRKTRRIGIVVLAASLACTVWLGLGMHSKMTKTTRTRSRPTPAVTKPATKTDKTSPSGDKSTANTPQKSGSKK
ncbi:MAG: hypothetical protein AAF623_19265, partial [Planctomycetota bacterium]